MDDLIGMIATGESPADVSDQIKGILSTKAFEKIEAIKPYVAASMFDMPSSEYDSEDDDENDDEDYEFEYEEEPEE